MFWENKQRLKMLGAIILAGVMLFAVTACGDSQPPEITAGDEEIWGTAPEEPLGVAVETPYMTFYYPQELEDRVDVLSWEDDSCSITTFHTELSGKDVELFSVVLSPNEENGYLLGQLNLEGSEEINVYTRINEPAAETWTEEELMEFSALQERVNDIIAQFYENEAFQPDT